ncbi:MAG: ABC transporter ATP-binding protein [Tissierellia bacterium]|nr:ABC transporter ATP-binding protein [Tissierellia bacterium]
MNYIELKSVQYSYNEKSKKVLDNISFMIDKGDMLSIIGPNGSGKSTLLKLINGIIAPNSGSILFEGKDIDSISKKELARKFAFVMQQNHVDFEFTCEEIVMMGRYPYLRRFESESEEDLNIVIEAMKNTGVYHLKDKSINEISGGEKQRVFIAKAIAQTPEVLFIDEGTSNLDIRYKLDILKLLQKLNEDGMTIVMVQHDLDLTARFSKSVCLLHNGKVHTLDTPEGVFLEKNIRDVYGIESIISSDNPIKAPIIIPL